MLGEKEGVKFSKLAERVRESVKGSEVVGRRCAARGMKERENV